MAGAVGALGSGGRGGPDGDLPAGHAGIFQSVIVDNDLTISWWSQRYETNE